MKLRSYLKATNTPISIMRREMVLMFGSAPTLSSFQKISKGDNVPSLEVANMIVAWSNDKVSHEDLVVDSKRRYTTRYELKREEPKGEFAVLDVEQKLEDLIDEFL